MGKPTYLSKDKESFVVTESHIEGVNDLPMESHAIEEEFQNVIKPVKIWSGNKDIATISTTKYCCIIIKHVKKRRMIMTSK